MNIMRVLIVDDEVIIRNGLSTVIDWEANGFSLLEPAESGEEGLEITKTKRPHIILTDIRMNGMSGLEMAKEVKQLYPETEIIVLSGYDEFAYAQEAMRQGVSEYLLKTSGPDIIMKSAIRAKERILQRKEEFEQGQLEKIAFKNNILEQLIFKDQKPNEKQLADVEMFYPNLIVENQGDSLQVIFLSASNGTDHQALHLFLRKELKNMVKFESMEWEEGILLVLKNRYMQDDLDKVRRTFSRAERALNCKLFAAVGQNVEKLNEMNESFTKVLHVIEYRWLMDDEGYMTYDQVKLRKGMRKVCSKEEESELADLLKSGDVQMLEEWIIQLLDKVKRDPEVTPNSMRIFLQSILISGYRWLDRVTSTLGIAVSVPDWKITDEALWISSPDMVLLRYFKRVVEKYRQINKGRDYYIQEAIFYIRENSDKNITLREVASHVHLNPNYFSEVFRRETGMNYIDFVKEVRIEKAMSILRETPAKISEVARQVGYEDLKYFSKLFREYTGETPSDFRKRLDNTG